ncbi:MAG: alkaline phosphatase D family protein [Actinomycetota bacterium]|nr:alkaline phosphatase D family protein [Actinomycetota bacterium]
MRRRTSARDLSRRQFLTGAAATGFAIAAGCSSDESGAPSTTTPTTPPTTGPGSAMPVTTTSVAPGTSIGDTTTTNPPVDLPGNPFTLGVASGDPDDGKVILWTRLAPDPADSQRAGMPDEPVDVEWQVALDEDFTNIVTAGRDTTDAALAHSVHVDVGGLAAGVDYFYRFTVGDFTSPVGRTRVFPRVDAPLARLKVAVVNCQMREFAQYGAYRDVVEQRPDLVLHLGDYIYEYSFEQALPGRRPLPHRPLVTLADFRQRFASYKSDPDLQAAHQVAPFVCMWDDHEVANNYAGDALPDPSRRPRQVRSLRAAAYRAYWEHLPLRLAPPDGPEMTLFRSFTFGDLATLHLLDERQYADVPPCRTPDDFDDFGDCDEVDEPREYLGRTQQAWLHETAGLSAATWNLIGNPTVVAGVNGGTADAPAYYLDTWDGYPQARRRFLEVLDSDRMPNPIVLTGDYHAGMVADVHEEPGDPSTSVVCTELMAPAISSVTFGLDPAVNPHVRHAVVRNGYLLAEITRDAVEAQFRIVEDPADRESRVETESTWRVTAGDKRARRV